MTRAARARGAAPETVARNAALGVALAVAFLCGSCAGARRTVAPTELVAHVTELRARGATLDALWYQGRRDGHDHFLYEFGMYGERTFRVPAGEAPLARWFVYSGDRFDWVRVDTEELMHGRFVVEQWRGGGA